MNTELEAIQTALDKTGEIMERITSVGRSVLELPVDLRETHIDMLVAAADTLAETQHSLLVAGSAVLAELHPELDVSAPVRAPALGDVLRAALTTRGLDDDLSAAHSSYNDLRTALESPDGYTNTHTDFSCRLRDV